MDSFVLLAYASLAALTTLLQQLLACLNFNLESEDLSFWYKQRFVLLVHPDCTKGSCSSIIYKSFLTTF